MIEKIKILAISGSLRSNSSNTALIKAIEKLVPDSVDYTIFDLAHIPLFDESDNPPESVHIFRQQIANANGALICSPEYAYGISGVLKNALDWTVSSGEFYEKPVAIVTAAINGEKAHAALLNVLEALGVNVMDECTLVVPFVRSKLNKDGDVTDNDLIISLKKMMDLLIQSIRET